MHNTAQCECNAHEVVWDVGGLSNVQLSVVSASPNQLKLILGEGEGEGEK